MAKSLLAFRLSAIQSKWPTSGLFHYTFGSGRYILVDTVQHFVQHFEVGSGPLDLVYGRQHCNVMLVEAVLFIPSLTNLFKYEDPSTHLRH